MTDPITRTVEEMLKPLKKYSISIAFERDFDEAVQKLVTLVQEEKRKAIELFIIFLSNSGIQFPDGYEYMKEQRKKIDKFLKELSQ